MAGDDHLPKLTGPEHMAEGRRLLAMSDDEEYAGPGTLWAAQATAHFAAAQVHATLALAKTLAPEDEFPPRLQGWE